MVLRCRKECWLQGTAVAGRKTKPSLSPKSSPLSSPHPTPQEHVGVSQSTGLAGAFSSAKYCRGEELGTQVTPMSHLSWKILPLSFLQMLCELGQTGDLLSCLAPHPSSCNRKCSWEEEVSGLVPQSPGSHPMVPGIHAKVLYLATRQLPLKAKPNHPSKFHNSFGSLETSAHLPPLKRTDENLAYWTLHLVRGTRAGGSMRKQLPAGPVLSAPSGGWDVWASATW